MATLYTIGYKQKALADFIGPLRQVGVDGVIDIRLRNTSHLLGYTKQDTLDFLLREGFGIAYEHHPELAPTSDILDAYREDGDWSAYEIQFLPLLKERQAETLWPAIATRYQAPCLLCAEASASHCHRRLVAEYWATHYPNLTIIHL
ncbi:MAG TPA: DUF488 domain-containing protein [Chloroflexi bacterium]|nr:DUF488 domain-containing protein [Chloroflexota bacterium]